MKIGVITFVSDAQYEDLIIESLINGDLGEYYLELRAITISEIENICKAFDSDEVPRILITDLPLESQFFNKDLSILQIDLRRDLTRQEILAAVASSIRNQKASPQENLNLMPIKNFAVVTGTSGSPGISTLAINLAYELANEHQIRLVDADAKRSDLAFLMGGKRDVDVVNLSAKLSISERPSTDTAILNLIDCGSALDLSAALTDRRKSAREFCNYLEGAGRVLFVVQPENNLMYELERFLEAYQRGVFTAKPVFVVNKVGDSQRQRSIQKRAFARIGNLPVISLPLDQSTLERSKSQYSPIAEVAPRSKLRKSIRELAELLIE